MATKINREEVLKWFTGKPRERAEQALDLLSKSQEQKYWEPGASRKVRASLEKSNVARKWLDQRPRGSWYTREEILQKMVYTKKSEAEKTNGYKIASALYFCNVLGVNLKEFKPLCEYKPEWYAFAQSYIKAFTPVAKLMNDLDKVRPKPVFTFLGVSRRITKTLMDADLALDIKTIRLCPTKVKWEKREVKDQNGRISFKKVPVLVLVWPKKTRHYKSRFAAKSYTCHSCGHAIYNGGNWVPILIDDKKKVPHALWVGRDCAKQLFGIDIKGELTIQGSKMPSTKK